MSDYTLSYTGAQVNQLLGRAGSAVTTQDQAMSSDVQATIRNNIGAASKTVETAVASLSANIVTLNSRMDSFSAYTSKVDELYDTTVPSLEAMFTPRLMSYHRRGLLTNPSFRVIIPPLPGDS